MTCRIFVLQALGSKDYVHVAKSYGFQKVITLYCALTRIRTTVDQTYIALCYDRHRGGSRSPYGRFLLYQSLVTLSPYKFALLDNMYFVVGPGGDCG
jgi:hypothetical protein